MHGTPPCLQTRAARVYIYVYTDRQRQTRFGLSASWPALADPLGDSALPCTANMNEPQGALHQLAALSLSPSARAHDGSYARVSTANASSRTLARFRSRNIHGVQAAWFRGRVCDMCGRSILRAYFGEASSSVRHATRKTLFILLRRVVVTPRIARRAYTGSVLASE